MRRDLTTARLCGYHRIMAYQVKDTSRALKFTPERVAILIDELSKGTFRAYACARARISHETFRIWLANGDRIQTLIDDGQDVSEQDKVFAEFAVRVYEAELKDINYHRNRLTLGGVRPVYARDSNGQLIFDQNNEPILLKIDGDWRANATYLEKRYPKMFGKAETVEVNATGTVNVGFLRTMISETGEKARERRTRETDAVQRTNPDIEAAATGNGDEDADGQPG